MIVSNYCKKQPSQKNVNLFVLKTLLVKQMGIIVENLINLHVV